MTTQTRDSLDKSTDHDPLRCPICSPEVAMTLSYADRLDANVNNTMTTGELIANETVERHRKEDLERYMLGKAATAVDFAIRNLPLSANGVAGFLQGKAIKGGRTGQDNALAVYLNQRVGSSLILMKIMYSKAEAKCEVTAEQDALLVDTGRLQLSFEPPIWMGAFIRGLRRGDFKELVK